MFHKAPLRFRSAWSIASFRAPRALLPLPPRFVAGEGREGGAQANLELPLKLRVRDYVEDLRECRLRARSVAGFTDEATKPERCT